MAKIIAELQDPWHCELFKMQGVQLSHPANCISSSPERHLTLRADSPSCAESEPTCILEGFKTCISWERMECFI